MNQYIKQDFVVPIKISECLYIMNLNRENKSNKLSTRFMESIQKSISYYENNSTLKSVVLRSFDQQIFSKGTDYESLKFAIDNNDLDSAKNYLDSLFEFADFMSATNLALIVATNGRLCNSAASIFTNLPFVYCNDKTFINFNEVDLNSPLLAGSSYTLSRLPEGMGMFLGLTGSTMTGAELKEFGFIKEFAEIDHVNIDHIVKTSPRLIDFLDYKTAYKPLFGDKLNKLVDIDLSIREYFKRSETENNKNVLFDLFYRKKIIEHANYQIKKDLKNPETWLQQNQEIYQSIENYLFKFEHDVLKQLPEIQQCDYIEFGSEKKSLINEIFTQTSVEAIFNKLESSKSEFSKEILSKLKTKNPKILEVIFTQIKKAESLTFGETLKMEYNTAWNMIESPDFKDNLFTKQSKNQSNEFTIDFEKNKTIAQNVFATGENLETSFAKVPMSFLPVKEFYNTFPESFRCYFNSQALKRTDLSKSFHEVIKSILIRYGVDYFNPTFDKLFVLSKLQQYFQWKRKMEVKEKRMVELAKYENVKNSYFNDRFQNISDLESSSAFDQKISDIISKVFEDELFAQEDFLTEKNKILGRLSNLKNIEDLNKIIIDRLSDTFTYSDEKRQYEKDLLTKLPLEISSSRFSLSEKNRKVSQFDIIQSNYQRNIDLKSKNELKQFYKNLLSPSKSMYKVEKIASNEVIHDKNHILFGMHEEEPKMKGDLHVRLGFYLLTKTETRAQKTFRERFHQNLIDLLEKDDDPLTPEKKLEVLSLINRDIILKYENIDTIQDVINLTKTQFLHFCRQLRPSYEAFDPNLFKTENQSEKNINVLKDVLKQSEIDDISNINNFDFSKKKTQNSLKITSEMSSLIDLLFNTEILNDSHKTQLKALILEKNVPFFVSLTSELDDFYKTKFYDLFGKNSISFQTKDNKNEINEVFNANFVEQFRNDFAALILPHLLYKLSNLVIEKLEGLFYRLSNFVAQINKINQNVDQHLPKIAKVLNDFGVISTKESELMQNIKLLDDLLGFMLELNFEYSQKTVFKEDLLKIAMISAKEIMKIKIGIVKKLIFRSKNFKYQEFDREIMNLFKQKRTEMEAQKLPELSFEKFVESLQFNDEIAGIKEIPFEDVKRYLLETFYIKDYNFEEHKWPTAPYDAIMKDNINFSHFEHLFDHMNIDEANVMNKLKTYSGVLSEYIKRVSLWKDSSTIHLFNNEKCPIDRNDPNIMAQFFNKTTKGEFLNNLNLKEFIKHELSDNTEVKNEFLAIQNAVESSFFTDLITSCSKMYASFSHGVYASAEGSRVFEAEKLKDIIIKKTISNKIETVEKPLNWYTEKYLISGIFPYARKLDVLSKHFMQNVKSGALENFYYNLTKENTSVPESFNELDHRQSARDWIEIELYKYIYSIFQSAQMSKKDKELDYICSNLNLFFEKKVIVDHLTKKLYFELFMIDKLQSNMEDMDDQVEARVLSGNRTDPELLNWKKKLENEDMVKRFLAFEAFAFYGHEVSKVKAQKNYDHLTELSKKILEGKKDIHKIVEQDKILVQEKIVEVKSERLFEEVVNSLNQVKSSPVDSLDETLAKSITNVARRLKLYK